MNIQPPTRQAIQTKGLGPTNTRGQRVKAWADAGSVTLDWNHSIGIAENHTAAARALLDRLGWEGEWVGGGVPDGYVFVQAD